LSEGARRVLTTAAVVGRTFSLALLEALEGAQSDAALEALEEAERAQLVVAESSGRELRYRFTHELIRQTLAEGLSLPRRQRLHARVAEAIERVYAASVEKHASALAHHLYQAGTAADVEKTTVYLLLAADQARAAAAHEESLALVDHALSLYEGETGSRVADLHGRRAAALRSLGRTSEAVEAYERTIALFDAAGDFESLAAKAVELGLVHGWNAHPHEALRVVDRALERLGEMAPALRCSLLLTRALYMGEAGDLDGGFVALASAQELQRTLGDPRLDSLAAFVETGIRWHAMQFDRAAAASRDAIRRSQAVRDVWGEVDAGWVEPWVALCSGRPGEGLRLAEERRPLAERIGHQTVVWLFEGARVFDAMWRGDLEAAERAADEWQAFGQTLETGFRFLEPLSVGLINSFGGRCAEGVAHFQDALDREPKVGFLSGISATALAWVLAHEGDPAADDVLRVRPPRLPERGRIPTFGAWVALANVVETLALLDRRDEAAALRASAEDLVATGVQCNWSVTMFATAAGVAAACAREWTRAEVHHQRAIQQADAAYRICQPDARVWYADMLLARGETGDRDRARALLAEALALYESIGMPGFAQRTSARLAGM
jgi:tetratricopeptide (TPR) repeat protein